MPAREDLYQYIEARRKRRPDLEDRMSENNFAALLMDSAAKAGSLGGQTADSSGMRQFAEAENKALEKRYAIDPQIANYLGDKAKAEAEEKKYADTNTYNSSRLKQERELAEMNDKRLREQADAKAKADELDSNRRYAQKDREIAAMRDNKVNDAANRKADAIASEQRAEERHKREKEENQRIKQAEENKEVLARFNNMKLNVQKMKDMIATNGTYEMFGDHNDELKRLVYDISTDYAKIKDPTTAAMGGEVKTAMDNIFKFVKNPKSTSNATATKMLQNFDGTLDQILAAREAGRKGEIMAVTPKASKEPGVASAAPPTLQLEKMSDEDIDKLYNALPQGAK